MICRVCDSTDLSLAVDLGKQPWANHFLKPEQVGHEPYYPLQVVLCCECQTAQLDFTVPKETMFSEHTYLSGTTRTLNEHFKAIATEVNSRFFKSLKNKSMLDVGSNDGTQLKHYKSLGYEVLGVEPSKLPSEIANAAGLTTLREFFNAKLALSINRKFEVINASGVFFHLEELHSVTSGIRDSLAENGVFVIQFLYMKRIVENNAFDQIYHEHLLYYNLRTIDRLLRRHGLALFDAELHSIHGGSIIAFATHSSRVKRSLALNILTAEEDKLRANSIEWYEAFSSRLRQCKVDNLSYLQAAKLAGKRVWGLGAPVKGNTLLNFYEIGSDLIECLIERNPHRRGLISPGSHLPVRIEDEIGQEVPDVYYVLAWNFKTEILDRYANLIERGVEFYFPVNPREV